MNYHFSDRISSLQPSAIREILKFTADPSVISFAAGNPAPEAFPVKEVAAITADVMQNDSITALQYSISEGYAPLRNTVKEMMDKRYASIRSFDDLIIVSGAQQGIELTTKVLCNEGDTVLCENPSFIGSLNSFRSYHLNLVGIPMLEDGIDTEALEAALKREKNVRFLYLIPNFQNPSGITMSFEKRQVVYALAKQYGILILEDNPYGELRFAGEDIPTIKSLDTEGIVIYCGSFSKILSPGMRVGFVCAPSAIVQKIVVAKQVSDVHTNILAQIICDRFIKEYSLDDHINHIRAVYKHKCGLMLSLMDSELHPAIKYTRPQGGLFIWCTLPERMDMMAFCRTSVENKVAVVPGSAFTTNEKEKTTSFRLNFSTPTDEQLISGMEILGRLSHNFCK